MNFDTEDNGLIPYDTNTAIALDSLQVFVETFSSLHHDIEQTEVNMENIHYKACIAIQDRVNKCMLEVIERILGPNYNHRMIYVDESKTKQP